MFVFINYSANPYKKASYAPIKTYAKLNTDPADILLSTKKSMPGRALHNHWKQRKTSVAALTPTNTPYNVTIASKAVGTWT